MVKAEFKLGSVDGEGRNTNSPKIACVGGYVNVSLRTADAFPVVASPPPKEEGSEATTGNASAVRRLC